MNTYLQILKFNFKMMNSKSLALYLITFMIITIYRLFFMQDNIALFSKENMTLDRMIIIIVFTIFLMSNSMQIWMFKGTTLGDNTSMVPRIRERSLIYSGLFQSVFFIWSIFICNFNDISNLSFFTVTYFWFISIFTSLFLYFSGSKISILIMPALIFLTPLRFTHLELYPNVIFILEIFYILLVIFQIKAFANRYIHFKERVNYKDGAILAFLLKYNSKLEDISLKKVASLLKNVKNSQEESKHIQLFQHYLFGYGLEMPSISITIYIFIYLFLFGALAVAGIKYGSLIILALYLLSLRRVYNVFRIKNKIEHLYVVSKLSRDKFELTLLRTIVKTYLRNSLTDIPFIIAGYIIYDKFYGNLDLLYFVLIISGCFIVRLFTIYISWFIKVRKRDYDKINGSNIYSSI